jgi:hypothetical protein
MTAGIGTHVQTLTSCTPVRMHSRDQQSTRGILWWTTPSISGNNRAAQFTELWPARSSSSRHYRNIYECPSNSINIDWTFVTALNMRGLTIVQQSLLASEFKAETININQQRRYSIQTVFMPSQCMMTQERTVCWLFIMSRTRFTPYTNHIQYTSITLSTDNNMHWDYIQTAAITVCACLDLELH